MNADTTFEQFAQGKKGAHVKKHRGPVKRLSIHPVAGGFVSEAEHEDMGDGKESMMYGSNRSKKQHKTAEDLGAHVSKMFGGQQLVPDKDGD